MCKNLILKPKLQSSLIMSVLKESLPAAGQDILSLATCMTFGRPTLCDDDLFSPFSHFVSSVPPTDSFIPFNLFQSATECHQTFSEQSKQSSG